MTDSLVTMAMVASTVLYSMSSMSGGGPTPANTWEGAWPPQPSGPSPASPRADGKVGSSESGGAVLEPASFSSLASSEAADTASPLLLPPSRCCSSSSSPVAMCCGGSGSSPRTKASPASCSSEEEEEDEEEEEEEEIDVVTVERRRVGRRLDAGGSDSSPLVLKRCHVNIHQHNYAAQPSPPEQPAGKRAKSESVRPAPRQGGTRRCWSPRASDGEDNDKRRTHNVLERQRRNELKLSFLTLRDEIPEVANNDKAAKVLILKKAAECIMGMRTDEQRLVATKEELRKRSEELKHRLQLLRTEARLHQ